MPVGAGRGLCRVCRGYDGGAALVDARDNVVMTRTFSKLYGLGGLRVGWGYGPRGD